MTLAELIEVFRTRKEVAERHDSWAPVAAVYESVIKDLGEVDGFKMSRKLTTKEAAAWEGVSERTIRRRCREGDYPGAEKTSEGGDWRIPASDLRDDQEEADGYDWEPEVLQGGD